MIYQTLEIDYKKTKKPIVDLGDDISDATLYITVIPKEKDNKRLSKEFIDKLIKNPVDLGVEGVEYQKKVRKERNTIKH